MRAAAPPARFPCPLGSYCRGQPGRKLGGAPHGPESLCSSGLPSVRFLLSSAGCAGLKQGRARVLPLRASAGWVTLGGLGQLRGTWCRAAVLGSVLALVVVDDFVCVFCVVALCLELREFLELCRSGGGSGK